MSEPRSTARTRRSVVLWAGLVALLLAVAAFVVPRSAGGSAVDGPAAVPRLPAPTFTPKAPHRVAVPAQPASLVYGGSRGAEAYATPGGLVVAGRTNYGDPAFRRVAAGGGTVLVYLDPVVDETYGRYHELLLEDSPCGPAAGNWPGSPRANEYGTLTDFRVGSPLQAKLRCVLERMVAENPHMGGWFVDDLGSRSWFPGIHWESWSRADQRAYRQGAIELSRTFREVADEHGLVFVVNGTWSGGGLEEAGGGYPERETTGNALADGAVVEHHDDEAAYFEPYACSPQWAAGSPVTRGHPVNLAVTTTEEGRRRYAASPCFSHVTQQRVYELVPPWGAFRDAGLPTGATR